MMTFFVVPLILVVVVILRGNAIWRKIHSFLWTLWCMPECILGTLDSANAVYKIQNNDISWNTYWSKFKAYRATENYYKRRDMKRKTK